MYRHLIKSIINGLITQENDSIIIVITATNVSTNALALMDHTVVTLATINKSLLHSIKELVIESQHDSK
jgi:CTP:molybdopterin cytidylyltransferase MocA